MNQGQKLLSFLEIIENFQKLLGVFEELILNSRSSRKLLMMPHVCIARVSISLKIETTASIDPCIFTSSETSIMEYQVIKNSKDPISFYQTIRKHSKSTILSPPFFLPVRLLYLLLHENTTVPSSAFCRYFSISNFHLIEFVSIFSSLNSNRHSDTGYQKREKTT